jgi:hypothetical protein
MNLNRAVVKMTHNKSINYARNKRGPDALTCAGYCDVICPLASWVSMVIAKYVCWKTKGDIVYRYLKLH